MTFPRSLSYSISIAAVLPVLALGLSSCATSPNLQTSKLPVTAPEQWQATQGEGPFAPDSWVEDFGDAALERIVSEALDRNYDLRAAAARFDAAAAGSVAARSTAWPSLTASGSGSKSRRSSAGGIQQTPTAEVYGLSARFAWEIDLWGKLRNARRATLADDAAAWADYRAARLSIAARTAKAWYAAIEATKQYELEVRILEALNESGQIVEENFARGIARALDVRLVRSNLASSRSSLEQRLRARDAAVRALETLLGRYPSNELALAAELPVLQRELPAGLPSELLLRRPDVVAAERRLAAAEQRAFEAKKARLPSFDLALTRGTNASEIGDVFEWMENRIWTQSLSVAQTLFAGGRLKADARRARAVYEQTLADYTQAVLVAYEEVENALGAQASLERDFAAAGEAAFESVEAEKLAWEEYGSGLSDITTALDSVRRSIAAQRSYIQVQNQKIQNRIDLYLALGGGFELEQTELETH